MSVEVDVQYAATSEGLPGAEEIRAWTRAAIAGRRVDAEVSVRVVDEAEITRLNRTFRGRDQPTNVLAFPFDKMPAVEIPLLGDVVICAPVVSRDNGTDGKGHSPQPWLRGPLRTQRNGMTSQRFGSVSGGSWMERLGQTLLGEPKDRDELIEVLRDAQQRGLLGPDVLAMIEGALQVSDLRVRDVMVPRAQVVMLDVNAPMQEIVERVIDSGHSRFPVYRDSRDEVEGILLAKDILPHLAKGESSALQIQDIMRPAVFIPETKRLNNLLRDFRSNRRHMAIVVDEYGGVSGLVTIEDVLEQIVGDIYDELDAEDDGSYVKQQSDSEFVVKAVMPIEDFNQSFGTAFQDEEFDTVGGLLLKALGHLPRKGEALTLDDIRFEVMSADGRRIDLIEIDISRRDPDVKEEP